MVLYFEWIKDTIAFKSIRLGGDKVDECLILAT
jgi:hypothetical protein